MPLSLSATPGQLAKARECLQLSPCSPRIGAHLTGGKAEPAPQAAHQSYQVIAKWMGSAPTSRSQGSCPLSLQLGRLRWKLLTSSEARMPSQPGPRWPQASRKRLGLRRTQLSSCTSAASPAHPELILPEPASALTRPRPMHRTLDTCSRFCSQSASTLFPRDSAWAV